MHKKRKTRKKIKLSNDNMSYITQALEKARKIDFFRNNK
jgi:hypothetical protein